MPPPPTPITPSPHRFALPRPHPKPPSSLHNAQSAQHPPPQFAATPRFSLRPPSHHADSPVLPPTSPLAARAKPPWKPQRREEIEDTASSPRSDDPTPIPSIDPVPDHELLPHHSLRPRKRPRSPSTAAAREAIYISDDAASEDSSVDSSASPASEDTHSPPPPPLPPTTTPRFHFPTSPSTPTAPLPPRFVLPTPLPTDPPVPLPEVFSPHRRGAKYLPSGLAATCREWVLAASQRGAQTGRGEEWVARVKVEEVQVGERMVLVRGGEGERWMLMGGGRVGRGETVGVKRPVWEVEVEGGVWGVGVEWRVLGEGEGEG
ncbi:hypothetical protein MMC13_000045 [Lambiella insularis]|nr:hypothetical protein [Lambiella insularis]